MNPLQETSMRDLINHRKNITKTIYSELIATYEMKIKELEGCVVHSREEQSWYDGQVEMLDELIKEMESYDK